MSIEAIGWVANYTGIKGTAKAVLVWLANAAGPDAYTWIGTGKLSRQAGFSRATVCRGLAQLESLGVIERFSRERNDGSAGSSVTFLSMFAEATMEPERAAFLRTEARSFAANMPDNEDHTESAGGSLRVRRGLSQSETGGSLTLRHLNKEPLEEPSKEPDRLDGEPSTIPAKPNSETVATAAGISELATELWNLWPQTGRKRSSKKQVDAALRKLAKSPFALLHHMAHCVREYTGSEDAQKDGGKYVPGLHRWLNDHKFDGYLASAPMTPDTVSPALWRALVDDYRMRGAWDHKQYGPPPGDAGCRVPPQYLGN